VFLPAVLGVFRRSVAVALIIVEQSLSQLGDGDGLGWAFNVFTDIDPMELLREPLLSCFVVGQPGCFADALAISIVLNRPRRASWLLVDGTGSSASTYAASAFLDWAAFSCGARAFFPAFDALLSPPFLPICERSWLSSLLMVLVPFCQSEKLAKPSSAKRRSRVKRTAKGSGATMIVLWPKGAHFVDFDPAI
jgi:hypothetical protein